MSNTFLTSDGVRLAWQEMGPADGRPLLMIHGYFSDAHTNWIKYGTAARLAEAGFRCIMPDLRAHGESEKPHDVAHYFPDALVHDQRALIAHLGLTDFDLAGYSLGARTAVRMLAGGMRPRRAILSGMGLNGITDTGHRAAHFRHVLTNLGQHQRGTEAWMAEAFLKTTGGDPVALNLILETFVDTPRAVLETLDLPIGVVCGTDDQDNGSAEALADALPQGRYIAIPGNHMSAVTRREMGEAFVQILTD